MSAPAVAAAFSSSCSPRSPVESRLAMIPEPITATINMRGAEGLGGEAAGQVEAELTRAGLELDREVEIARVQLVGHDAARRGVDEGADPVAQLRSALRRTPPSCRPGPGPGSTSATTCRRRALRGPGRTR